MHRDLVENRAWISEDEYKEGLTLAQLSPGPLAAQLGIYIGYIHYGLIGATLAGVAFVIPSFIMVVLLGMAYKVYSGLPWIQAVFYGVSASVIGIIALSSFELTTTTISKLNFVAVKRNWLLWLFFVSMALTTVLISREEGLLFIAIGLLYMFIKAPPVWFTKQKVIPLFLLTGLGFWQFELSDLGNMAWFFTKAGAFVFGSGLAIVPFLHTGVVNEFGWLNEHQFIDAVAIAMITPGPVIITVGFIGYLVGGFPGACIAASATFLPCYLFTVIPAPYFHKIAKNKSIKAFVDGITAAVIGALAGAVIIMATRSIIDIPTVLIAIGTILLLVYIKKLQEPHIIAIAAIIGVILKTVLS